MSQKACPKMCTDHPDEDLRFYCLICEVTICRDCKIVSHDGHKADLVSSVAKDMKAKLIHLLDKIEQKISKLKEKAEGASEKVEPRIMTDGDDVLKELKSQANSVKTEIDKLVGAIECEIKLYDNDSEWARNKITSLAMIKESILEATGSDYGTVASYKKLMDEASENVIEEDGVQLTKTEVEGNLLPEFKVFFDEILEDIRDVDVKRIFTGQPYRDASEEPLQSSCFSRSWVVDSVQHITSSIDALLRFCFCTNNELTLELALESGFGFLQIIFCLFPVLQAFPILMLLENTYPVLHPVARLILAGTCVSVGILMLMDGPRMKAGALLFAGIFSYLAVYPYLDDNRSGLGTMLIFSRHLGCISVYLMFADRTTPGLMKKIGESCITGYVLWSLITLYDGRIQVLFPGGKYFYCTAALLCVGLSWYLVKRNTVSLRCVIVVASCLVFIDTDLIDPNWMARFASDLKDFQYYKRNNYKMNHNAWNNYEDMEVIVSRYEARLYWTVVRLIICNVTIMVGMLINAEQTVINVCQQAYQNLRSKVHKD